MQGYVRALITPVAVAVISMASLLAGCQGWHKPEADSKHMAQVNTLFSDRYDTVVDAMKLLHTDVRQAVPSPTGTLASKDAVEQALSHNLSLATQSESLLVAQANLVQAGLLPNPGLGQSGGTYFPMFGGTEPNIAFDILVNIPINDFLVLPHKEAIARAQRFQAGIDLAVTAFSLAQQTQQQYQQLVYLTRDGDLQRRIANTYKQAVDEARAMTKAGLVTRSDYNRAVIAYEDALRQAHHYDTQYEGAARQLNWLMGCQEAPQWKLAADLSQPPTVIETLPDQRRMEQLGVKYRLDLLRADYDRKLAEQAVRLAKLGFIPQTTVGWDFSRDSNRNWTGGPSINSFLPIFDPGIIAYWIARYQQEQTDRTYVTLRAQVGQDVRNALTALQIAAEDVIFSRDITIPQEEENIKQAELSFKLGVSQFDDLLNAIRQYVGVLQAYEDQLQAYHQAVIGLESAVGLAWGRIETMSADVHGRPTSGPVAAMRINPISATVPATLPASVPAGHEPFDILQDRTGTVAPEPLPGHKAFDLMDEPMPQPTTVPATAPATAPALRATTRPAAGFDRRHPI